MTFRGYVDGGPLEPGRGVAFLVQDQPTVTYWPSPRRIRAGAHHDDDAVVYVWSWGVWMPADRVGVE